MKYQESQRAQSIDALFNEYDSICHEVAQSQGLADSAYDVLRTILVLGEGCTQTQVCQMGYYNKQTINSAVKKLVAQEILVMKAGKGRENQLYFTKQGKALVERSVLPFEQMETEIYDEFSEEEYRQLVRLVKNYVSAFRNKVEKRIGEQNHE